MKDFFVRNRDTLIILAAIVAVGIFLRTYHFSDWLQFSPDEARDASVINGVIGHGNALPLLGPIAGGTNFHLGPMFYYFQYTAALIFGNFPDRLAYPDLFFGILAIPLLFAFLKRYFTVGLSLSLAALMSVSYFFVSTSRFASNPNSIPFFLLVFLYAFSEMMDEGNRKRYRWPMLVGISMGVGVQLHTLLLLILPTFTIIVFGILARRKRLYWKNVLLIAALSIAVNIPQIRSEMATGGANVKEFFAGAGVQSRGGMKVVSNIGLVASCQIQANAHFVSSLENIKGCGDIFNTDGSIRKYRDTPGVFSDGGLFTLGMILGVAFSLLGYVLLGYFFRKETEGRKKDFLLLTIVYGGVAFLWMIPVAGHIELRYFAVVFFIPFVLLGLCLKLLSGWRREERNVLSAVILASLLLSNIMVLWDASAPYREGRASDTENSILGEIVPIAAYVSGNAGTHKSVYVYGERVYYKRIFGALEYLLGRAGLQLVRYDENNAILPDVPIFFIAATPSKKDVGTGEMRGRAIVSERQFANITIYVLK